MKRQDFLKTGLGAILLGMVPFSLFGKNELIIKKNPVVEFTPEMLSQYNVGCYIINAEADLDGAKINLFY